MNERVDSDVRALEAPVPRAEGMPYLRFLRRMHLHLKPEWYLEIGTNKGRSLARAPGKAIAVDPAFIVNTDVVQDRPQLHMFRQTSDDFFASGVAARLAPRIDMAFLDGLHLFEFLLRDFMNTEKLAGPGSIIAMHDVIPYSYVGAERDWNRALTKRWTGDVWKIVPILREYRPDLDLTVVDCAPTGLGLVTNLDPENRVLDEAYDQIVARYMDMTIGTYGEAALDAALDRVAPNGAGSLRFVGAGPGQLDFAIKVPARTQRRADLWGEYHYANSLADALRILGHSARVDCLEQWETARRPGEIDMFIRGGHAADAGSPDNPRMMWLQSNASGVGAGEIASMGHVFVASDQHPEGCREGAHSTLLQCTDARRFRPANPAQAGGETVLFVGHCYPKRRAHGLVSMAVEAGLPVNVFGRGWDWLPEGWWKGRLVPNDELARHYASAGVVLNDHHPSMLSSGYVNNRIYDVLACARPVVSDPIDGLPEGFAEFVRFAGSPEDLREVAREALSEPKAMRKRRIEFAQHVRAAHSFDARAAEIIAVAQALPTAAETAEV